MRLIDVVALDFSRVSDTVCKKQAWEAVEEAPTVDAVPVIRCRECKYCTQFEVYKVKWFVCTRNNDGIDMNADDYCSKAERKEECSQ